MPSDPLSSDPAKDILTRLSRWFSVVVSISFFLTKIGRMKAGKSHNTGSKPRAHKNRLGQSTTIAEPKVEKKIKRVMPQ
jgi:ribosomal protein L35